MSSCTLCPGNHAVVTDLSSKEIQIPGYSFVRTCGELEFFLPLVPSNSTECALVHSLSTMCGCPIADGACHLCNRTIPEERMRREIPVLAPALGGITPTCDMFQSYLHAINETDPLCAFGQSFVGDYCGCHDNKPNTTTTVTCSFCPSGDTIAYPDKTLNISGIPFRTCREVVEAVELLLPADSELCGLIQSIGTLCGCPYDPASSCSLCPTMQEELSFPSKEVGFLNDFGDGSIAIVPTCEIYQAFVRAAYAPGEEGCLLAQSTSGYCGCPSLYPDDTCRFCDATPYPTTYHSKRLGFLEHSLGQEATALIQPTCELLESFQWQLQDKSPDCIILNQRSFLCGCNDGVWDYGIAADTEWKRGLLVWTGRFTGTLSFVCSVFMLVFVLCSKKRRGQVYQQLIAAMVVFDAVTGFAWMLSTLMTPREVLGDPSGVYGSMGNELTCKISGFLVQLGFTSVFYNVSLTFYYSLVIVYDWRESRLKKIRLYLHGLPLLLGFGLAFGAIPLYKPHLFGCYLYNVPLKTEWEAVTFFGIVPTLAALIVITTMTVQVYAHVSRQTRKAMRWRFGWHHQQVHEREQRRRSTILERLRPSCELQNMTVVVPDRISSIVSNVTDRDNDDDDTERQVAHRRRSTFTRQSIAKKTRNRLEQQVMVHAIWYMLAFWVTWPIVLVLQLLTQWDWYWFGFLVFYVAPLQGVNNFLVYFRPKFFKWSKLCCTNCCCCCNTNSMTMASSATGIQNNAATTTFMDEDDPNVRIALDETTRTTTTSLNARHVALSQQET